MAPNTALLDPLRGHGKYQKKSYISRGTYGFVQLVENKQTKEQFAIKFLERGATDQKYLQTEILNHRQLRHPHIVEFKEVFLTKHFICIAMEYASGGSLYDLVVKEGHLSELHARWYFQQLIVTIDFCHRKGIANRDLKLENTLLQKHLSLPLPLLKICDFGYSKADSTGAPRSRVGTVAYMAPDVLKGSSHYDAKKADIWSCGIILYIMLYGDFPFALDKPGTSEAKQLQNMYDRIHNTAMSVPKDIKVSDDCWDLLNKLLNLDASKRVTIEEIFQHSWFNVNLPPAALTMNDVFVSGTEPVVGQSVQEIKAILSKVNHFK